ncbi:MAG: PA14 domain-containing protein, partial [Myxococcota bacterium]
MTGAILRGVILVMMMAGAVQAQGLQGDYYSGTNFGEFQASRVDGSVDFGWTNEVMPEGMNTNSFSVRWIGTVQPRYSESHTFFLNTDDGSRLWVDGQLVIDGWSGVSNRNATVSGLQTDRPVPIMVEYWQSFGGSRAILEWQSATQVREVITNDRLTPVVGLGDATVVRLYITGERTGERSSDRGQAVITRFGPLDEPLMVSIMLGGDAVAGEDYAPVDTMIEIPARRTSVGINISVLDDAVAEPEKTVEMQLASGAGYTVDPDNNMGTIVIEDDDSNDGPVTYSIVGQLEHGGTSAGHLVAVAWSDAARTVEVDRAVLVEPGIYSLPGLEPGTYYVSGFLDEDRNGMFDEGEQRIDADPVMLPPDALGLDFDFTPDCDAPNAPASCMEGDAGGGDGTVSNGTTDDTGTAMGGGDAGSSESDAVGGSNPASGGGDDGGCQQLAGGAPQEGAPLGIFGCLAMLGWAVWVRRRRG